MIIGMCIFQDEFVLPLGEIETESVLQLRLMMIIWLSLAVSLGIPGNLMGEKEVFSRTPWLDSSIKRLL